MGQLFPLWLLPDISVTIMAFLLSGMGHRGWGGGGGVGGVGVSVARR